MSLHMLARSVSPQGGSLGCESWVTSGKVQCAMDLLDKQGSASQLLKDPESKSEEESSSRNKKRDNWCGGQSNKPK